MDLGNLESLTFFGAEAVLVTAIVVILGLSLVLRDEGWLGDVALAALALSLVALAVAPVGHHGWIFSHMAVFDPFAVFFKALCALAGMFCVWMSMGSGEVHRSAQAEYYTLLLAATLGAYLMASASNLLGAYLALEMVSLCSYALAGFLRHARSSSEAALKYAVYGGVASAVMLYGMSWLYGLAGSLELVQIHATLVATQDLSPAWYVAVALIVAGFGFKVAAVPFHMWAPDVYAGAPVPVGAFLSVVSKAGGMALLLRLFLPTLSNHGEQEWSTLAGLNWVPLLTVVAVASMTLGNLAALRQTSLKRLLAYSGVAHAGYMLLGLLVRNDAGVQAILFYLVAYAIMNLGAFAVVVVVVDATGSDEVGRFRSLAWRGGVVAAVTMTVFLASLVGLPPFAGFFAKLYLFAALMQQGMYVLALFGVLNSVLSAAYYFRVARELFAEPDGEVSAVRVPGHDAALLVTLAIATLAIGLLSGPLYEFARYSLVFYAG